MADSDRATIELLRKTDVFQEATRQAEGQQLERRKELVKEVKAFDKEREETCTALAAEAEEAGEHCKDLQKRHRDARMRYQQLVGKQMGEGARCERCINKHRAELQRLLPDGYTRTIEDLRLLIMNTRSESRDFTRVVEKNFSRSVRETNNMPEINSRLAELQGTLFELERVALEARSTEELREAFTAAREKYNLSSVPGRRVVTIEHK